MAHGLGPFMVRMKGHTMTSTAVAPQDARTSSRSVSTRTALASFSPKDAGDILRIAGEKLQSSLDCHDDWLMRKLAERGIRPTDERHQWCVQRGVNIRTLLAHLSARGRRLRCVGCTDELSVEHLERELAQERRHVPGRRTCAGNGNFLHCVPCLAKYRGILSAIG